MVDANEVNKRKSKNKSCQLRRTNTDMERTFQKLLLLLLLDIKLRQFTQEEINVVRTKLKAAGLDEISLEVWKTRKFDLLL